MQVLNVVVMRLRLYVISSQHKVSNLALAFSHISSISEIAPLFDSLATHRRILYNHRLRVSPGWRLQKGLERKYSDSFLSIFPD